MEVFFYSRIFLKKAFALLFPQSCVLCHFIGSQIVCKKCQSLFRSLPMIVCPRCGNPSPSHRPVTFCQNCISRPPAYDRARSSVFFEDPIQKIIHLYKYSGNYLLGPFLASLLSRSPLPFHIYDRIVPVPLHPKKLRQRKFNPAALIAQQLGKIIKKPVDYHSLRKDKETLPQAKLSHKERLKNLKGSFHVMAHLQGQKILLVDDVFTSGATSHECAKTLKGAGAARVDVATVARTPSPLY